METPGTPPEDSSPRRRQTTPPEDSSPRRRQTAPGHGSGLTSIRRHAGKVFRSDDTDEWVIRFEVICPDCGDDGGPYDEQPDAVQAVRGPYTDAAEARQALQRHTGA